MKKLLELKNWQIFLLFIGLPIMFIITGVFLSKVYRSNFLAGFFPLLATLTILITYFGWIWSIGVILPKSIIPDFDKKNGTFKLCFMISLILFILIPIMTIYKFDSNGTFTRIMKLIGFILFMYCIYLASYRLKRTEKIKLNIESNQIIDFISIWILPIGVWNIQPRINRLISQK